MSVAIVPPRAGPIQPTTGPETQTPGLDRPSRRHRPNLLRGVSHRAGPTGVAEAQARSGPGKTSTRLQERIGGPSTGSPTRADRHSHSGVIDSTTGTRPCGFVRKLCSVTAHSPPSHPERTLARARVAHNNHNTRTHTPTHTSLSLLCCSHFHPRRASSSPGQPARRAAALPLPGTVGSPLAALCLPALRLCNFST